jgi:hypothetical protein
LPMASDGILIDTLFGVRCLLPADEAALEIGYQTFPLHD